MSGTPAFPNPFIIGLKYQAPMESRYLQISAFSNDSGVFIGVPMSFVAASRAVVTGERLRPRLPPRLLRRPLREEPALGFHLEPVSTGAGEMCLHFNTCSARCSQAFLAASNEL